jgi:hypothetical protein
MTGPLGVLPVGPTGATTEDGEDIDGGPLWGVPVGSAVATTEDREDVNGGPPEGC